jgi:hypothetical protein
MRVAVSTNASSQRFRLQSVALLTRLPLAAVAVVGLIALVGCGSSKPAYCSSGANLENSIKGLTNLNASSGVSGLESQLKKIESDAKTVVSSAKGDFPSQTSAINSSVDALTSAAKALPSNPSATQVATLASDAANVVASVKNFTEATNSKCS